ncbi:synaptonemal complex protein 3 isoform X1 [Oncorhynchus tshawytscha]|uniref:XLR/SYCP3/FAM9 domain-containing protein n=1 Tax=Oncorhynchus tshawytscha TaxID=74940 RepID=A0AAZ3Q998_ONCTS|nr:synaptonemal complex protein 3 isoform X1 [Oncorhynchus tshawytscha]
MAMHKGHAQKGKAKGTITNSGKPYMEDFNESFNNENLPVVEAEALRGRKHMSEPDDDIDITKGGDMMTMLDRFGADINKAFLAKRKRLKTSTKSSVKTSHQKIEQLWRVQQRDRSKVTEDYCTQFNAVFSQWDTDVQKSKDNEEKLLSMFQHPQKMFQHKRASQRLKTLKQLLEQYIQSLDTMEKTHVSQQGAAQGELRQEMALFQKKILSDTVSKRTDQFTNSLSTCLTMVDPFA